MSLPKVAFSRHIHSCNYTIQTLETWMYTRSAAKINGWMSKQDYGLQSHLMSLTPPHHLTPQQLSTAHGARCNGGDKVRGGAHSLSQAGGMCCERAVSVVAVQ